MIAEESLNCRAKSVEACFIRDIEKLTEEQIFLVMRDKLWPYSLEDESLDSSPFSLQRFRVAHSDNILAVMVDAESAEQGAAELCFDIAIGSTSGATLCVRALAGGEAVVVEGRSAGVLADVARSFSCQQHPALGGNRLWRIVLVRLGDILPHSFVLRLQAGREGCFEGSINLV